RELALKRYREFETDLGPILTRFVLDEAVKRFRRAGILYWPAEINQSAELDKLVGALAPEYGRALAKNPALEDVAKLCEEVARHLATLGALKQKDSSPGQLNDVDAASALALHEALPQMLLNRTAEALGSERKSFTGEVFK